MNWTYTMIDKKNFYDQAVGSDIKWYEEIRKLTTEQGEDYTTGCLSDYDYIKNHHRLIAVDLSRQNKLDAIPKAIQEIEFEIESRKCNTVIKDGKLSRSKS